MIRILAFALLLLGCSDHKVSGGNSSETGTPLLAGTFLQLDGAPAVGARVYCVPDTYSAANPSLEKIPSSITDSAGHFSLATQGLLKCNLEARLWESSIGIRMNSLVLKNNATFHIFATLLQYGTLRIGLDSVADHDSVEVYIPGSMYTKIVPVQFSSIVIDSILPGSYDSICIIKPNGSVIAVSADVKTNQQESVNPKPLHYELQLNMNTTSNGIGLTETLLGFPLALRLDSTKINPRFITSTTPLHIYRGNSNLPLAFATSRWNTQSGDAEIWVRLDTILPDDSKQFLRLVWDESDSNTTTQPQPFSNADQYLASWHFDEGANQFLDAGQNGYDGKPKGLEVVSGAVGSGLSFDGKTSFISIPGSATGPFDFVDTSNYTISVWIKLENPSSTRFIYAKGAFQYQFSYKSPNRWMFRSLGDDATAAWDESSIAVDTSTDFNQWIQLTVVRNNGVLQIFKNGQKEQELQGLNSTTEIRSRESTFEIGRRLLSDGSMDRMFGGNMDELQISNTPRSPEWIRICYLNQMKNNYWPE